MFAFYATYVVSVRGRTEAWKSQVSDPAADSMLALPVCKQEYGRVGRRSGQVDDLDYGTWVEVFALEALSILKKRR